jgi:hypothetical protein
LRRWRFTLASPPQPLRSPSKTRPPLPPYKSRRMCLEVEDFDFFADGDGQTILTMDGSRDVFAWRERAGEEVERWLLELEGEKREGRGSTGSRIRGKAVDNEVEVRFLPPNSYFLCSSHQLLHSSPVTPPPPPLPPRSPSLLPMAHETRKVWLHQRR